MLLVPASKVNIKTTNLKDVEDGIKVYTDSATFQQGEEVQNDGVIWECLKNNLTGVKPAKGRNWTEKRKINKLRAFDAKRNIKTSAKDLIRYEFNTSHIDTLALFGLKAKEVVVNVKDKEGIVKETRTFNTYNRDVYDLKDLIYAQAQYKDTLIVNNLQMFLEGSLEVILKNEKENVQVAHIVYGRALAVGLTIAQNPAPKRSITKNILKNANNTSTIAIHERLNLSVIVDANNIDSVFNRIRKHIRNYVLIVGDERDEGYSSLTMYGEYKDVDTPFGLSSSIIELELEGVEYE